MLSQNRRLHLWRWRIDALLIVSNVGKCSFLIAESVEDVGGGWLLSIHCVWIRHRIWISYLQLSSLAFIALHGWPLYRLALMNNTSWRVAFRGLNQFCSWHLLLLLLFSVRGLHDQIVGSSSSSWSLVPRLGIVIDIVSSCETSSPRIRITLDLSLIRN